MKANQETLEEMKRTITDNNKKLEVFQETNFDMGNTVTVVNKKLKTLRSELSSGLTVLQKDLKVSWGRLKKAEVDLAQAIVKQNFQEEQRKAILDTVKE